MGMTQTVPCDTDYSTLSADGLDAFSLGLQVVRLAGMIEFFGWSSPAGVVDYAQAYTPETQLLIDLFSATRGDCTPEARARLRSFAENSGVLDQIAAAMV